LKVTTTTIFINNKNGVLKEKYLSNLFFVDAGRRRGINV